MPSDTARHDYPFMVDGDPLADVATIMQTLAERIEAIVPVLYHTTVVVASGSSFQSKSIVWPTAYAAAPSVVVQASTKGAASAGYYASAYNITTTGCDIRVDKAIGAPPGVNTTVGVAIAVAPTRATL